MMKAKLKMRDLDEDGGVIRYEDKLISSYKV